MWLNFKVWWTGFHIHLVETWNIFWYDSDDCVKKNFNTALCSKNDFGQLLKYGGFEPTAKFKNVYSAARSFLLI